MDGISGKRVVASIWCLLLLLAVGCADFAGVVPPWLTQQEPPGELPGVVAPVDRIAGLRELAKQGPTSSPERQQRVADQLAESIAAEEDPLVRAEIIRTLAGYGAATATRVLHAAVEDPDEDVRIAACRAWATRGDAEAIAVLGRTLTGDTDVDVRLAAASALGESRDPAAVAALEPALSDKDPALQYRAVLSLRTITGQDFGNDVRRWQQYVRGELPAPPRPVSVVERFRELF